jgi:hypothetical protein
MRLLTFCSFLIVASLNAGATTYYVDPSGSNANDGLSPQTPWRTLLKVGISTFQPGDVILFKRDGVWNEWLTPPSSGAPGNLIKFDAYGNGHPPEFTGNYATSASQWTNANGNVWQMTLAATQPIPQLKFVQFGTIWGNAQLSQNALAHDRDWYYDSTAQNLYVWSNSGNPVTHYGSVTPILLSGESLINLNNVSYIEVRWSDSGWGPYNDRNLVARFTTQTFTVPRLSQIQDCYLRQYDNSNPPKYSRCTTALHLDYPLS